MSWANASHEARHVVCGWFSNLAVESAALGVHSPGEGIVRMAPVENGIADLLSRLVGWIGDPDLGDAVWPPKFPPPSNPDVEGVARCVRRHGLSKQGYEATCELARELCEDDSFRQATDLVARALMHVPLINREGLEELRQLTDFADEAAA